MPVLSVALLDTFSVERRESQDRKHGDSCRRTFGLASDWSQLEEFCELTEHLVFDSDESIGAAGGKKVECGWHRERNIGDLDSTTPDDVSAEVFSSRIKCVGELSCWRRLDRTAITSIVLPQTIHRHSWLLHPSSKHQAGTRPWPREPG